MPTYIVTTKTGKRHTVRAENDDQAWDKAAKILDKGDSVASVELAG